MLQYIIKSVFSLALIFWISAACAQDSLQVFNRSRNQIKTTGMEVLGSWGIVNIAIGVVGYNNSGGATQYFYQMDAIWGIVNTGIAALGYIGTQKDKNKAPTPAQSLAEQKQTERIFLINGGLDMVYIGTGIYLNTHGNTTNSDRLRGYGPGIIVQGAFLLLFDATMYTSEKSNGHKLRAFLQKNPVTFNGRKIGINITI